MQYNNLQSSDRRHACPVKGDYLWIRKSERDSLQALQLSLIHICVEKGRLALVAVVMIPAILFIAFRKLNLQLPHPRPDNIAVLLAGAVVIGILWIIMSIIISIGIYQKKEL